MKKFFKNNKGFTLVELIIVIAVMAILTVVAAPRYIQYVEDSREGTDVNAIGELAHLAEIEFVEYSVENGTADVDFELVIDAGTPDFDDTESELEVNVGEVFGGYEFKSEKFADTTLSFEITGSTGKCKVLKGTEVIIE